MLHLFHNKDLNQLSNVAYSLTRSSLFGYIDNIDFINLVKKLDAYLKIIDGEDHAFYNQYNNIDVLKYSFFFLLMFDYNLNTNVYFIFHFFFLFYKHMKYEDR